jgi:hypothetical protein
MPEPSRLARHGIAYDRGGRVLALVDAEDLLVHDGETGAPLFRESFGEPLLGVTIAGDDLVVVGELGLVVRLTLLRRELSRVDLDATLETFAARADGVVAVAQEHVVSVVTPGEVKVLKHARVSALAFSSDGATLLLAKGDKASRLVWLDATTFEPLGELITKQRVHAIVPRGSAFYVAQGAQLDRLTTHDADVQLIVSDAGFVITDVAFAEGRNAPFALQCERSIVDVYEANSTRRLMRLQYPMRVTRGVAFGPGRWLGIGLSGGDANRIQLDQRSVLRTTTHPGREHAKWIVSLEEGTGTPRIEGDGARGLKAQPQRAPQTDDAKKALAEADELLRKERRRFDLFGTKMDPDVFALFVGGVLFVLYILFRAMGG